MPQDPQQRSPNIVLITTDQHHAACLGCHGHPLVRTPAIDSLAADGVDFRRAFAQSAICMPSRVTLMTGQYPHTHGILANAADPDISRLTMLPAVLRDAGYATALVGKNHAGRHRQQGFDYGRFCAGPKGEGADYVNYLRELGLAERDADQAVKRYDAYVSALPYRHSVEAWIGDETLRFLDSRDRARPFFLWTSFNRPHPPTCVPSDNPFPYPAEEIQLPPCDEAWFTAPDTRRPGCEQAWSVFQSGPEAMRRAIANYLSIIAAIDDQVGRVLRRLDEQGGRDNTLIVFTSDHGAFCGEHGQFGKNLTTYDALYQVPLIMNWRGRTGREVLYEPVELTDLMPTVLDAAGVDCPRTVQGRSVVPALLGSGTRGGVPWRGRDEVFFETPFVKTVRTRRHKLSYCFEGNRSWGQLYDLASDPTERRNLYDDPASEGVQRDLERRLLQWFIATQQPQSHGVGADETAKPWRWYGGV